MLILKFPREPRWLELPHGVRVLVRPLTTAMYESAKHEAVAFVQRLQEGAEDIEAAGGAIEDLPDLANEAERHGFSQFLFVQSLARLAITAWEGVGEDFETPAEVTPDTVNRLMRVHSVAEAFIDAYTRDYQELIREGNGSGPAPDGTSDAGRTTAKDAGTRTSPAAGGNAARTAGSAPTGSTRRARGRASRPGAS